jgi:hypothetical protein
MKPHLALRVQAEHQVAFFKVGGQAFRLQERAVGRAVFRRQAEILRHGHKALADYLRAAFKAVRAHRQYFKIHTIPPEQEYYSI